MIVKSETDLQKVLDLLNKSDKWAYDIESNSLNTRSGSIIGFSGASDAGSFYVIHKEWNGAELVDLISKAALLPIIEKLKNKQLIGHNASFDTRFTYNYFGVKLWPSLHHDTQLAAHTCDENRFNYKLKDLGQQFFGPTAKAEQAAMEADLEAKNANSKGEMFKANSQLLAEYGRKDAELTWDLYKKLHNDLEAQGLTKFFYEDEVMPLYVNCTIEAELRGVPVDVPALQQALQHINTDMDQLESEIQTAIKPHLNVFFDWFIKKEFPYKFSGEFRDKLGNHIAPPNWPRTKTGGYSFSKVDLDKAVKKGLIDLNCEFYLMATQVAKPSEELVRTIQLELLADTGVKYPFNLLSKHHLKKLFFDTLEEKPLSKTKPSKTYPQGQAQVDDAFLEKMALKYDWAAKLQTYNSLSKIKGTYIERFLEGQEDGIFYPQVMQHRTTSGRYSGDCQQLPRMKTEEDLADPIARLHTNKIRNFFISKPGWKFVDADYSSLEVVVFADDAQDEALLDIIRKDYDFYSQVAIQVNKLTDYSADKKAPNFLKKHKPEIRQRAKAYALGIRYGEGSFKLHHELKCSQAEAEAIITAYFAAFPKLKARMDELVLNAKSKGTVKSKGGRIRHLPELKQMYFKHGDILSDSLALWKEYHETPGTYEYMKGQGRVYRNLVNNSLNYPIQSMAATIVSKASIAIMREFKAKQMQAYIALSVHDELCIHCPDSEVAEVAEIMQRLMENTTKLSVPLAAEPVVGTRYGDVK